MATSSFRHGHANDSDSDSDRDDDKRDDSDSDSDDYRSNSDRNRLKLEIKGIGDRTKRAIEDVFQATVDNFSSMSARDVRVNKIDYQYRRLEVLDIQRVVNPYLKTLYEEKKAKMRDLNIQHDISRISIRKLPESGGEVLTKSILDTRLTTDSYINEYFLFHGTLKGNVDSITKVGLQPSLAKKLSIFGPGIYCTESASKADQYADERGKRQPNGTELRMFLVTALMGNVFVSDKCNEVADGASCPEFKRPPCLCCKKSECRRNRKVYCDSVLGNRNEFYREFVLYENAQIYPEFIITYRRV